MHKSLLIERGANLFPWPFRTAILLSRRGFLPQNIGNNWLAEKLLPQLFADGVLGSINGERFYVPAALDRFYRDFEPTTRRVIEDHMTTGSVFVDVGANVGYFSILADRLGATVHAFEPGPAQQLLRRNLQLHRSQRVVVHPVALGTTDGAATFHHTVSMADDGLNASPFSEIIGTSVVPRRMLDSVIVGRVDFIKTDIQGGDLTALQGMTRVIRENAEIKIISEWAPAWMVSYGHRAEDMPTFFRDHGLTNLVALFDHGDRRLSVDEMLAVFKNDTTGNVYCNLFASRARLQ